jgi:hypothetical protein
MFFLFGYNIVQGTSRHETVTYMFQRKSVHSFRLLIFPISLSSGSRGRFREKGERPVNSFSFSPQFLLSLICSFFFFSIKSNLLTHYIRICSRKATQKSNLRSVVGSF